ncbi:MAG: hypothetical protein WCK92_08065 [Bacteroidota bacterium]
MIEENILYKLINNKYHFCYYIIEDPFDDEEISDYNPYGLEYCQGEVGEFPDYEVEVDKDIDKIRSYKDEVVKTYNIKEIPSFEIQVSIFLEEILKNCDYDKFNRLFIHITRTIDFVSKTAGLGINNFVCPSETLTRETGAYNTRVMVNDKEAFQKIFIDLISSCGITMD